MGFPKHIETLKHNKSVNEDTMRQLLELKPNKIVDVGAGDGFYGKLIKYLLPEAFVLAVEKRGDYISQWELDKIYDEVINDDIINVVDELNGDLIIFGDILEHLEEEDATKVLDRSIEIFKYVLINSPLGFQPQEHLFPEEIHRCGLDRNDFENYQVLEFHIYCNNKMFNCLLLGKGK